MHGLFAPGRAGPDRPGGAGRRRGTAQLRASGLVGSLRTAATSEVPSIIKQLDGLRRWADPELRRMLRESSPSSREHLHASMALLADDPSQVELSDRPSALRIDDRTSRPSRVAAAPPVELCAPALVGARIGEARRSRPCFAAASSLALYAPNDPRWTDHAPKIAERLVRQSPVPRLLARARSGPLGRRSCPLWPRSFGTATRPKRRASASWPRLSSPTTSAISPSRWPIS